MTSDATSQGLLRRLLLRASRKRDAPPPSFPPTSAAHVSSADGGQTSSCQPAGIFTHSYEDRATWSAPALSNASRVKIARRVRCVLPGSRLRVVGQVVVDGDGRCWPTTTRICMAPSCSFDLTQPDLRPAALSSSGQPSPCDDTSVCCARAHAALPASAKRKATGADSSC